LQGLNASIDILPHLAMSKGFLALT